MKKLIETFIKEEIDKILSESSLSRIWEHTKNYDCAIISASRADPLDFSLCVERIIKDYEKEVEDNNVKPSAKSMNSLRSRDLRAALLYLKFGVTKVDGSYVENFSTPEAIEVKEDSFFVVNLKNNPKFVDQVINLGKKFCQDSVLIIPKGGQGAYLFGTNDAQTPGLNQKISLGDVKFGKEDQFMTKIRNRPFVVGEGLDTFSNCERMSKWAIFAIAKKIL